SRDFRSKPEYTQADRAYNSSWGALDEYRDGYRQGFEAGYGAGYERRPFDSSIPPDLKRKGQTEDSNVSYPTDANKQPDSSASNAGPNVAEIPRDTIMTVELLNGVSTDASQKGDPFQARVIEPKEYQGATIDGHVADVKRPGKVKGTAQLQLSFDNL